MTGTPLTGGCLCGAVRYTVTAAPVGAATCHCRMCQRQSGSAFMGFFTVPEDAVEMTGDLRLFQASPLATRGFCPSCGSNVTMRYAHEAGSIGLTMGTLDEPDRVPPRLHWGVESWVGWLHVEDGLERQRTEDDPEFLEAMRLAGMKDGG